MEKRLTKSILFLVAFLLFLSGNIWGQNTYVLDLRAAENHYFEIADNDAGDLDLGTDYTIECWVYIKNTSHGNERILRSQDWQFYIMSGTGSGGATATIRMNGNFLNGGQISLDVPTEEWHHICLQGNSAGGWTNNYLDGAAKLNGGAPQAISTINLRVGSYHSSVASTGFRGAIDEVRISSGNRYGRWGFSVDKTDDPYTSDASTILLFNFDNDIDNGGVSLNKNSGIANPTNSSSKVFAITNVGVDSDDYTPYDDGSFAESLPLPVELTTFTASVVDNSVALNWETATEINNHGFDIERVADDGVWSKVAFVEGHGNSNVVNYYSYNDYSVGEEGTYFYRLKQVDIDGGFEYSDVVEVNVGVPSNFELSQNYPNPFNPTTTIKFSLPEASQVKLSVYNLLGEKVTELVNEVREAGTHNVMFDASNLTSGLYIYRIETNKFTQTMKMMLTK